MKHVFKATKLGWEKEKYQKLMINGELVIE